METLALVCAFLACILVGAATALSVSQTLKAKVHIRYRHHIAKMYQTSESLPHPNNRSTWQRLLERLSNGRWATFCHACLQTQERLGMLLGLRLRTTTFRSDTFSQPELSVMVCFLTLITVVFAGWLGLYLAHNLGVGLLMALAAYIFLPYGEARFLERRKQQQRVRFEREIPQMLSMIALIVQAGASFDTALQEYATRFQGPLARHSQQAIDLYMSKVCSRSEALDELSKKVDAELFYRFISTVKRALYLGSPLSVAIESQLHDIRAFREEFIREEISKKPIQILIPLGIFILPGMLILLLGPILMEVMRGIHAG